MNNSVKSQFSVIPVIISAILTVLLGTIIRSPTSEFLTWIVFAGFVSIPMGFILAYSVQMVKRKQVEYSLFRAVALGFVVGAVSFGLILVASSGSLIEWLYSFV
jgi:hypothetical protein